MKLLLTKPFAHSFKLVGESLDDLLAVFRTIGALELLLGNSLAQVPVAQYQGSVDGTACGVVGAFDYGPCIRHDVCC